MFGTLRLAPKSSSWGSFLGIRKIRTPSHPWTATPRASNRHKKEYPLFTLEVLPQMLIWTKAKKLQLTIMSSADLLLKKQIWEQITTWRSFCWSLAFAACRALQTLGMLSLVQSFSRFAGCAKRKARMAKKLLPSQTRWLKCMPFTFFSSFSSIHICTLTL